MVEWWSPKPKTVGSIPPSPAKGIISEKDNFEQKRYNLDKRYNEYIR